MTTAWKQYKPALIGALDVNGYGGIYGQSRAGQGSLLRLR